MWLIVATCVYTIQVCQGLYVVEVHLFGYNNPTGRCYDEISCRRSGGQRCCDGGLDQICANSSVRCDSYFIYCLRPLDSNGQGCADYANRTSMTNLDDGAVDFSQNIVLGLQNPLTLQGIAESYNSVSNMLESGY